jgi:hypothetical protein
MKRQTITPASLTSPSTDSLRKGLQQYYTPQPWATALAAALPDLRKSILDLHCGDGSFLRGVANPATREIFSLDLDPAAHSGKPKQWEALGIEPPRAIHFTGDVLDLHPLLVETETRFDLILANPPFSLRWPIRLLHKTLVQGLGGKFIDSTHTTLRMLPTLLSEHGEAMMIANADTITRLREQHPEDFSHVWLHVEMPSFFPGVSTRIAVLYLSGQIIPPVHQLRESWDTKPTFAQAATTLGALRKCFPTICITQPWEATTATRPFTACGDEMLRRNDPTNSRANVTLAEDGRLRTFVSRFQEMTSAIDGRLIAFLQSLNRKHPLELTLQRGTRLALREVIDCKIWTITPEADAAIREAVDSFDKDRAPLSPVSDIQRIGWIDDAEELLCTKDLSNFKAGKRYKLSTETIEWKKEEKRPRYHAGKRDQETILVRGHDLRITLHHPTQNPVHFIFNPTRAGTLHTTHSLETLAQHFHIPEAPDITTLHPEAYAKNLALIDELEAITP